MTPLVRDIWLGVVMGVMVALFGMIAVTYKPPQSTCSAARIAAQDPKVRDAVRQMVDALFDTYRDRPEELRKLVRAMDATIRLDEAIERAQQSGCVSSTKEAEKIRDDSYDKLADILMGKVVLAEGEPAIK